jgi:monothiol glutaredoxin
MHVTFLPGCFFNYRREWPTIPQLYVKGEFVGGCDIITDQYKSGDLLDLLQQHKLVE